MKDLKERVSKRVPLKASMKEVLASAPVPPVAVKARSSGAYFRHVHFVHLLSNAIKTVDNSPRKAARCCF